jgi:glutathionyl-hydroquinone reductase
LPGVKLYDRQLFFFASVPGQRHWRVPVRLRRLAAGLRRSLRPVVRRAGLGERPTGKQRYLVGKTITEADVRLFTTLVRFDPVYHGHFKCNRSKLSEMAVLRAYARDLFQTKGFGDTVDFVQIKQHYYIVHADINPTGIVPKGPELADWLTPHGREALGGRPFGDGTPPGPPLDGEWVPAGHGPS